MSVILVDLANDGILFFSFVSAQLLPRTKGRINFTENYTSSFFPLPNITNSCRDERKTENKIERWELLVM